MASQIIRSIVSNYKTVMHRFLLCIRYKHLLSRVSTRIFVAWQTCAYRKSWYGMFHCFAFVRRVILYVLSFILMGLYSKLVSILFRSSIPFDSPDMFVFVQMSMILMSMWFFFFSWKSEKLSYTSTIDCAWNH